MNASILVVDDEFSVRDSLSHWFSKDGYAVTTAENAAAALREAEKQRFDVAVLDLRMPGMDGLELQERLREIDPRLAVIVITAFASVETAVQALKQGAFDYVTKPVDPDELSHLVGRALERRRLEEENQRLKGTIDEIVGAEIVGESPQMRRVLELVEHVAGTDATVLIRGESGTGKELIARAIHAKSARRYAPLVPVNCGGLPGDLLEGELFGHEKGAFTGAHERRKGRLEMAHRGTLFLDEIGVIPVKMQVDLLRVLETKEVLRLGASQPVKVDFRVICASNDDLENAVAEGRFREDFYYRVNVFTIDLPPLRERCGDVALLARHFLAHFARQMDKRMTGMTPQAMARLEAHDWPGNVRELMNAVERAMVVGQPPEIRAEDLPLAPSRRGRRDEDDRHLAELSLGEIEKRHLMRVLEHTGWNVSRTAEILQVDRVTVYNKIKKFDLRRATCRGKRQDDPGTWKA